MGSPWEQFFDAMITSQDMDGIDLFGKKLPKKSATVKIPDLDQDKIKIIDGDEYFAFYLLEDKNLDLD